MAKKLPDIKKRDNGYFEMKITVAPNVRKSVYGKSETEVRRKAKQLREEAARYDISNITKMTVESYMRRWLIDVKQPDLKPGSFDRVEQSLEYQIFPYIGHIQLSALTSNDIQQMINSILEKWSFSTAKKAYNNLNSCLELAVTKGEITKNPVNGVKLPSAKNKVTKEVTAYTSEEIEAIVDEAKRTYSNGAPVYRYEAAKILASDFGIAVNNSRPILKRCTQPKITAEDEKTAYRLIDSYVHLLERNLQEYAPRSPDDYVSILFVQALHEIELFRYYRSLFYEQEYSVRIAFIAEHGGMLLRIERALNRTIAA